MPKSLLTLLTPYLKNGRTSPDNHHGTLDSNNFHFQPPSRFSSLLYFTQDFLPVKKTLSPSRRSGGTNFIRSARSRRLSSRCWISRCVCILLAFETPHSRDPVWLMWRLAVLDLCKLGPRDLLVFFPWLFPLAFCHSKLPVCFSPLILCINWTGVICARVVWSTWPRGVWYCWKCLNVVQSIESLRVMRMVGSHICTNRLRVHLESVHALMNFGNYFR